MEASSASIRNVRANNSQSPRPYISSSRPDDPALSGLLPTTFAPQRASNMRNPFNTILFGGSYYPGKDKKRRQLKRKTLWYKLFCSSRWRKALSFLISGCFLFVCVVRPFSGFIFEYGKLMFPRRRQGLHGTWLLYDESLLGNIKSIEEERAEAIRLANEQDRLRTEQRSNRLETLERIVPGWYHRNDADAEKNKVVREKLREAQRIIELRDKPQVSENGQTNDKKQGVERHASKPSKQGGKHNSSTRKANEQQQPATEKDSAQKGAEDRSPIASGKRRLANVSDDNAGNGVRSIHNMHLFRNKSSCPAEISPTDVSVTLVLQSTLERLWILKRTCRRWKGPIILVLALSDENLDSENVDFPKSTECPQLRIVRHILRSGSGEDDKENYPVNRLRNLGLDHVTSSHVLMVDIDFVPSMDLDSLIHTALTARNSLREGALNTTLQLPSEEREALVVPAFERIPPSELCHDGPNCAEDSKESLAQLVLPSSFDELHSCVLDKAECRVFQSHNNWDGHSSTRSKAWLNSSWYDKSLDYRTTLDLPDSISHFGRIRTLKCFDSVRYEPYVVLRWCPSTSSAIKDGPVAPYYDERFHGYGKNKIELISHLRVMGYTFAILPEGFIIHSPHSISKAKKAWESTGDSSLHQNMDHLYPVFLKDLTAMYKHEKHRIIKQC